MFTTLAASTGRINADGVTFQAERYRVYNTVLSPLSANIAASPDNETFRNYTA